MKGGLGGGPSISRRPITRSTAGPKGGRGEGGKLSGAVGHWGIRARRQRTGSSQLSHRGVKSRPFNHFRWELGGKTGVPENKFCLDVERQKACFGTMPPRLYEAFNEPSRIWTSLMGSRDI